MTKCFVVDEKPWIILGCSAAEKWRFRASLLPFGQLPRAKRQVEARLVELLNVWSPAGPQLGHLAATNVPRLLVEPTLCPSDDLMLHVVGVVALERVRGALIVDHSGEDGVLVQILQTRFYGGEASSLACKTW